MNTAGEQRQDPQRRCVGCRQGAPAIELVRFVAADGVLRVDASRRLPGRGAWVHPRRGCLERGLKRGGFAHALKGSVRGELPSVLDALLGQLERDALSRLGLLRRSGALVFGRDSVARAVEQGKTLALWLATDTAPRTLRETERLASGQGLPVVIVGTQGAMGAALGSAPVAVAGLPRGAAGERVFAALRIWAAAQKDAAPAAVPGGSASSPTTQGSGGEAKPSKGENVGAATARRSGDAVERGDRVVVSEVYKGVPEA
ncbi:MAG: DUF448 domain-containing protein [Pseudomonadota bacterium]